MTETPVYSGWGWKILTSKNIYCLNPDPYTICFADEAARTRLKPYLLKPAAQATAVTGIPITVTDTIDTTPITSVPARHRIVVHLEYQPMAKTGMSQTLPCYQMSDGSVWGGHIRIDTEYWSTTTWFSSDAVKNEAMIRNAVTHELGHALGLDHANVDLDGDGTAGPYEAPVNDTGQNPVMTSPNGGVYGAAASGYFMTAFDQAGLAQLAKNYYLRQQTTTTAAAMATRTGGGEGGTMAKPVH